MVNPSAAAEALPIGPAQAVGAAGKPKYLGAARAGGRLADQEDNMKVAAILREDRPAVEVTAVPENTMTMSDAEVAFRIVGVFVTKGRMRGKFLAWLQSTAIGPWSVRYLEGDGRGVIVMGMRFDAFAFLVEFGADLDVAFLGEDRPRLPAAAPNRRTPGERP